MYLWMDKYGCSACGYGEQVMGSRVFFTVLNKFKNKEANKKTRVESLFLETKKAKMVRFVDNWVTRRSSMDIIYVIWCFVDNGVMNFVIVVSGSVDG